MEWISVMNGHSNVPVLFSAAATVGLISGASAERKDCFESLSIKNFKVGKEIAAGALILICLSVYGFYIAYPQLAVMLPEFILLP